MKCIICNSKSGNSFKVASVFGWDVLTATEMPDLSLYCFVLFVVANTGDEELQPEMERFLLSLRVQNKTYAICELGNYFGYERDCFGCKQIVQSLLRNLNWKEKANISIDSLPTMNIEIVKKWAKELNETLHNN